MRNWLLSLALVFVSCTPPNSGTDNGGPLPKTVGPTIHISGDTAKTFVQGVKTNIGVEVRDVEGKYLVGLTKGESKGFFASQDQEGSGSKVLGAVFSQIEQSCLVAHVYVDSVEKAKSDCWPYEVREFVIPMDLEFFDTRVTVKFNKAGFPEEAGGFKLTYKDNYYGLFSFGDIISLPPYTGGADPLLIELCDRDGKPLGVLRSFPVSR